MEQVYQVGDVVMVDPNGDFAKDPSSDERYQDVFKRGIKLTVKKYNANYSYPYECICPEHPSFSFVFTGSELTPSLSEDELLLARLLKEE